VLLEGEAMVARIRARQAAGLTSRLSMDHRSEGALERDRMAGFLGVAAAPSRRGAAC
jgi:hypothetical protein